MELVEDEAGGGGLATIPSMPVMDSSPATAESGPYLGIGSDGPEWGVGSRRPAPYFVPGVSSLAGVPSKCWLQEPQ